MATTTVELAPLVRQRFWTRGRGFGVVYLLLAGVFVLAGLRADPGTVSSMGLGIIGKPPPVRVPVPTGPALLAIGLLLAAAGVLSLVRRLEERQENVLLLICFAFLIFGILIAAAAGRASKVRRGSNGCRPLASRHSPREPLRRTLSVLRPFCRRQSQRRATCQEVMEQGPRGWAP